MMTFNFNAIWIFIFVYAILVVIKNVYGVIKISVLKQGKVDTTTFNQVSLGLAISYIITFLIICI